MPSQDSVIVLSEDEEEEAEEYLKIFYQESEEFLDVPLESNKNVLSEDITLLDSRISALIIQKHGSKRIVKLKDEYVKEPKEKWKNVKVYAVLKKEFESVTSAESSYPSVTNKCNTKIESETPTVLNYRHSRLTHSLPSSKQDLNMAKAPERSSPIECNVPASERQNLSFKSTCKTDNSSDDLTTITDTDDSDSDVGELDSDDDKLDAVIALNVKETPAIKNNEFANSIMPVKEPTYDELLSAYKVLSFKELRAKLCRGDTKYVSAFEAFIRRLKRTMVACPNNEFVRLMYYVQMTDVMVKNLDSSAKDNCELCDEDFTLKHLISRNHVNIYHKKYKADPPEIAILLNPGIYEKCIDPLVLEELKINEYKKMEESSEFSIIESNEELFKLKYVLINRIIQENFVVNRNYNFSFNKFVFLRNNVYNVYLKETYAFFYNTNFDCQTCKKTPHSFHDYLQHILSESHLQNALNQKEFDSICKTMTFIEITSNGFRFLTTVEINKKRRQSSDNIQNGVKRHKKS